eukprot:555398_1
MSSKDESIDNKNDNPDNDEKYCETATLSDFNSFKNRLVNDCIFLNDVISAHKEWCAANGYIEYVCKNKNKYIYQNHSTSLYPTIIEKNDYLQLYNLSKIYHKLFDKMSRDYNFIVSALENVAKNDVFIRNYLKIYKRKYESHLNQTTNLGIFRSDYMQNKNDNKWGQIEINTASVGGWQFSQKEYDLNKYILSRYGGLNIKSLNICNTNSSDNDCNNNNNYIYFPNNNTLNIICSTLAKAATLVHPSNPYILIIPHKYRDENLVIEQRAIEIKLWNDYKIPCIRRSLRELINNCKLDSDTNELIIYDKYKISAVYTRMYPDPDSNDEFDSNDNEFESNDNEFDEWKVLEIIEFSTAINETVSYFLLGTKYIQSLCYNKDILLKYLNNNEANLIHKHMFKLYTLDKDTNKNLNDTINEIKNNPSKYVIKSQKEGGGNCYFDNDIVELFNKLNDNNQDYGAYIAMERVYPSEFESLLLYQNGNKYKHHKKCSSEIGFFSCYLSDGICNYVDEVCGVYSKTRPSDATEGGVSHGNGVIDFILILDA